MMAPVTSMRNFDTKFCSTYSRLPIARATDLSAAPTGTPVRGRQILKGCRHAMVAQAHSGMHQHSGIHPHSGMHAHSGACTASCTGGPMREGMRGGMRGGMREGMRGGMRGDTCGGMRGGMREGMRRDMLRGMGAGMQGGMRTRGGMRSTCEDML